MYLYFLPLNEDDGDIMESSSQIPNPTSDGGVEHTAAEFDYASNWLSLANSKAYPRTSDGSKEDVIMFPPQVFLLHLLAPLLPLPKERPFRIEELSKQRDDVLAFLQTSQPLWADKCISPYHIGVADDGRTIVGLDKPGPSELVRGGRRGDFERVILTKFSKAGPTQGEVRWRRDIPSDNLSPKANCSVGLMYL